MMVHTSSHTTLASVTSAQWESPAQVFTHGAVADLLFEFDPIALDQMDRVALLDRTDIKYVLNPSQLRTALASLNRHYRVLDVGGSRLNHYRTLYFDTSKFALYLRHHAGNEVRYKVRSREYGNSGLSFLEIKRKSNKDRTVKYRTRTPSLVTCLTPAVTEFVREHLAIQPETFEPKLWNNYSRITLVSRFQPERVTLDLGVRYADESRSIGLDGIVVAEVKQDGVNWNSDFVRHMRAVRIHPFGMSKYCIGVSLLFQDVKHNNFKPKLLRIRKLSERGDQDVR